jgi:endoglucanase
MFNSSDWGVMYSVGDIYDPEAKSDGLIATDIEVTGEGSYTVRLDFTGTSSGYANSTVFTALAISNGEILFPGYIITITDLQINGVSYQLTGKPYTTSDDGTCTRVNIYNEWVTVIPDDARTQDGDLSGISAVIVDQTELGEITTFTVTFDYGPAP